MRKWLVASILLALGWVMASCVWPYVEGWLDPLPGNFAWYQGIRTRLVAVTPPKRPPGPSDWLRCYHEGGQTLEDYARRCGPSLAARKTIYIQALSPFQTHPGLLDELVTSFQLQFGIAVRQLPTRTLTLPESARRSHPDYGSQLLTIAIHRQMLDDRPADALAVVALTESDLWPGPGWNYVFGQANLLARVGVWSTCRLEDADPERFLRRTLRTALHETGHLLGMPHCAAHECLMNGANSLAESDGQTMVLCGECAPKLWWRFDINPDKQLPTLVEWGLRHGWDNDARQWRKQWEQVSSSSSEGKE